MAYCLAFYNTADQKVYVEWSTTPPTWSPPQDDALPATDFITDFAASTLHPSKLWPYACYAAQLAEIAGVGGDPGGGSAYTVKFIFTSISGM